MDMCPLHGMKPHPGGRRQGSVPVSSRYDSSSEPPAYQKSVFCQSTKDAFCWSEKRDSNPQHSAWEADALPLNYSRNVTYYTPRKSFLQAYFEKKCRRKPIFLFWRPAKKKKRREGRPTARDLFVGPPQAQIFEKGGQLRGAFLFQHAALGFRLVVIGQ